MDLTKSQVTLFWILCQDKSWHVLLRPTLRWVPLQVRAFYWRCRDSGIYWVLQKRLSNLTLAEVAENLRQPQGSQEEEEGSGKGNFATSKNTSWLFRYRRCLTRPLGTTQPLLWWSNSWQWEGDPIRWDDGLALQGSRRWNSEKQTTATWVKAFAVKFGSHCKASTQQSSLNIPSFAIKKCRLEYCIILASSKGFLKGILILHWYYSWYLVGRFLLCESQFAVFSSLPGNPFSTFY